MDVKSLAGETLFWEAVTVLGKTLVIIYKNGVCL